MIEVFKTNVSDLYQAELLMEKIHRCAHGYQVNFDLEDIDRILRVQSNARAVDADLVIRVLNEAGFTAEVLPD